MSENETSFSSTTATTALSIVTSTTKQNLIMKLAFDAPIQYPRRPSFETLYKQLTPFPLLTLNENYILSDSVPSIHGRSIYTHSHHNSPPGSHPTSPTDAEYLDVAIPLPPPPPKTQEQIENDKAKQDRQIKSEELERKVRTLITLLNGKHFAMKNTAKPQVFDSTKILSHLQINLSCSPTSWSTILSSISSALSITVTTDTVTNQLTDDEEYMLNSRFVELLLNASAVTTYDFSSLNSHVMFCCILESLRLGIIRPSALRMKMVIGVEDSIWQNEKIPRLLISSFSLRSSLLSKLDLSYSRVDIKSLSTFISCFRLKHMSSLRSLVMRYCNLTSAAGKMVEMIIDSQLTSIDIGGNQLGAQGVKFIANMFDDKSTSCHLQELTIDDCGLNDEELIPLFRSLLSNTSLHLLNISGNRLIPSSFSTLCFTLAQRTNLSHLIMARCLSSRYVSLELLGQSSGHLKHLDLSSNTLTTFTLNTLFHSLICNNYSLTHLNISHNLLTDSSALLLLSQVQSNLVSVETIGNNLNDIDRKLLELHFDPTMQQ
jgi:hypothetical protein